MLLQYKLWVGEGSVPQVYALKQQLQAQQQINADLAMRNKAIEAQIKELKSGSEALEEIARNDLGMIASDETYYQIID